MMSTSDGPLTAEAQLSLPTEEAQPTKEAAGQPLHFKYSFGPEQIHHSVVWLIHKTEKGQSARNN